ncbi:MAG: peptide/nickel transport system substrate-binding protein [Rubrobacteraceae bacterium]|nr:peptide/nickel transport system substrate-binding protein [Rubrobacteraceae bacterium]
MLEANTDHWNTERGPRLEKVVFRNDISPAEALDLVCNTEGEVDIVTEVSPADAEKVENSEHAQLVTTDAMRMLAGVINRDSEPFGDVRARKALNLAVDRDKLIREGFKDYAYPLAGLIPHYAAGYSSDREPYPHDPDEAKRLLSEAGYPEGRALALAAPADLEGIANLLAEDFRSSLDIEVDVILIPAEDLLAAQHVLVEKVMDLPFDVLVHAWFDLTSDAPAAFLHSWFYYSMGAFRAGPPIPEFEELMERYVVQTDPQKLNELDAEMDQLAYEEALSIFLCAPQALYAVNRHVNFVGHATTFEVAETEVGDEHWSRGNSA